MILSVYLEQWLGAYVVPHRAASTAACYQRAINALPEDLTSRELATITGLDLQGAINAKAANHPRAAQLMCSMLHVALGKAASGPHGLGLIPRNPADACIMPQHQPKRAAILTGEQLRTYLAAARGSPAYPLLALIACCGLRRSEALGLTWGAIDLAAGTVAITQQRLRVHHGYQAMPLKSAASLRGLAIPPALVAILRPLRGLPKAWVVDCTPEALTKAHRGAITCAGLPWVTLHGLRHSYVKLTTK